MRIGVGGISQVAREAGVIRKTIRKGLGELEAGALYQPGERIRTSAGCYTRWDFPSKPTRRRLREDRMQTAMPNFSAAIAPACLSIADGKAIPYGIYDLVQSSGFVNVGIDHETAGFAVESIRRWWKSVGSKL